MLVDEDGILCIAEDRYLAVVVLKSMKIRVISSVHGTLRTGNYRKRRTLARMRGQFWWQTWNEDLSEYLNNCVPCTVIDDCKPQKQAKLAIVIPKRRLYHVAIDLKTITTKTNRGNTEVLLIIDTFTRFVRAVPVPDERAPAVFKID